MKIGYFLGGIAALIWDQSTNQYLLLRRSTSRDFQAQAWECVTGRVNQGESYEQALHREVQEEIGAKVQIEFLIATTHFYRGDPVPENELLGVIYGCTMIGSNQTSFSEEHSELRWASLSEINDLLPSRHWLHQVIKKAERLRATLPEELRKEFRQDGFELRS
jgi:8-oxo-dGTP diphosphatase